MGRGLYQGGKGHEQLRLVWTSAPTSQVNRIFQELALLKDIQEGAIVISFNFLNDKAMSPCYRCGQMGVGGSSVGGAGGVAVGSPPAEDWEKGRDFKGGGCGGGEWYPR